MGGGSGRWVKSLVGFRKSDSSEQEKLSCGGKKSGRWKLWRASPSDLGSIWRGSRGSQRGSASEFSDGTSVTGDVAFGVMLAAAARARPWEFRVLRQEWAAIRIQAAFRGFLMARSESMQVKAVARRALRALKAVVRIQAIVRGWLVRKQAAVTLKCMQSLVRVQARVRAHRVCLSTEAHASKKASVTQRAKSNFLQQAVDGWCNRKGTVEDISAKLDMKKDGAIRRERALAYSQSQQLRRSNSKRCSSPNSFRGNKDDKSSKQYGWMEKWMALKAWDHRLSGQSCSEISDCHSLKQDDEFYGKHKQLSEHDTITTRKHDANCRIPTKPLCMHNSNPKHCQDHSTSSAHLDILHGGNSTCPSSIRTPFAHKRTEINKSRPINELSAKPIKAKSSSSSSHMSALERRFLGESLPCNSSNRNSKIGACSNHSNNSSTCSQTKSRGPKGKLSDCNKENCHIYKNTPASVIMF